jgi:hypothetical protein
MLRSLRLAVQVLRVSRSAFRAGHDAALTGRVDAWEDIEIREVLRMTLRPRVPADLALSPVAAGIDLNLRRLRDKSVLEIADDLIVQLNQPAPAETRDARARQVLRVALRDVDLHGWTATISPDATRLQLRGGSVALDLGLSAELQCYIEQPAKLVGC